MQSTDKQILIVEDNKRHMDRACDILEQLEDVVIFKADNCADAYRYAMEYSIDLFIVDIILEKTKNGDMSGMTFADNIREIERYKATPIIFTTSLEDPKLHAYAHLHCYQYFDKYYREDEFKEAVQFTLKNYTAKKEREYIYFKTNGIVCQVKINDIVYIDNKISTLSIYCKDGEIVEAPYKSTKQLILELGSTKFLKCNKSEIVNCDYVKFADYSNYLIKLKEDFGELKIGRRILKSFKEGFENRI